MSVFVRIFPTLNKNLTVKNAFKKEEKLKIVGLRKYKTKLYDKIHSQRKAPMLGRREHGD